MAQVLEEAGQGAAGAAALLLEAEQPVQGQEGEAGQRGEAAGQGSCCRLDERYVKMPQACTTSRLCRYLILSWSLVLAHQEARATTGLVS